MRRWVVHIDMDAFYASCEQLTRPTLRNRPVLVGGISGRGVVAGASYEARKLGAHSAMPMWRAQALVGFRGVSVRPRGSLYKAISQRVFSIFQRYSTVVEQVSVDEAFLEPETIQDACPEEVHAWAEDLRASIFAEVGLHASVGAGPGKQVAKIGSGLAKPNGITVIAEEEFEQRIHPLPVGKLWGVGPVTAAKLTHVGVDTIGALAALEQRDVQALLGNAVGLSLWQMARGIDRRSVQPRAAAKQISAEYTYERDLITRSETVIAAQRACRSAHRRLLQAHKVPRTISVKLRMADFHIESRSYTLKQATDDYATLEAAALKILRFPEDLGPIRLVGVGFSGFEDFLQDSLFPEEPNPAEHVVATSDGQAPDSAERSPMNPLKVEPQGWYPTQDVWHPNYGHGWIQGIGKGRMTIRFETRTTGPGRIHSFATTDPELQSADPLDSLEWTPEDFSRIKIADALEEGSGMNPTGKSNS